ncbi:hypothetical protein FPY71_10115 [Aureimonas fodinaquatilis]|uniref:Phage head morphogenesis domain-containing protein n=1 Tax=Aureimonas fodinaquatilis TaxID=2565783 RepID=A0A5B0DYI0_9HYPH|nr:phage minor head protein [Aureimonas fodinaquatilis]KAA0970821.1 hypothetical protein FPY71_10115 [Aureimonas fodinaquatilis]
MQTFNLAELVSDRRRSSVILPPIADSQGAQLEYLRELRTMLRGIAAEVKQNILPAAETELATARDRLQRDMNIRAFDLLAAVARGLANIAEQLVERILRAETRRHRRKWLQSVRSALGIDIAAVVREEDLEWFLETSVTRNVGLIRRLADDTVAAVQTAVTNAILRGRTAPQLRKDLTGLFGISDRRAKTIARDQISKVTSDLNRKRHEQAGITEYVWMTSQDERVRSLHLSLEGKEYKYAEPTGAEQGLPPGQPINCRCIAKGIIRFNGIRI